MNITRIEMEAPYLILIGDTDDLTMAKTGLGIVQWRRELVAGQLRFSPLTNSAVVDLGVPDLTIEQAVAAGVKSLVIGVAAVGGGLPESWWPAIEQAARAGIDIVSGLHLRLADYPRLVEAARQSGAQLIDVRNPPPSIPVGTGIKRSGKRLLMVGTDCVVGKKYSALALHAAMEAAGMKATFRATGQTGIMIAGAGMPIDAVVSDFVSGAAECLSPDNKPDHWDVIEGQGGLFHPGYAAVSLGLLHGSQPDALVLCHDATRSEIDGWPGFAIPELKDCIRSYLEMATLTNPNAVCVGASINTSGLDDIASATYLNRLADQLGIPCVDPIRTGCAPLVQALQNGT